MPQHLTQDTQESLLRAISETLIAHAEELTQLDQAIGDGDHGINMKRGFDAVLEDLSAICALPLSGALKKVGMTLVMKVGGASGPLYGTLFLELAKTEHDSLSFAQFGEMLQHACDGVKSRGKSDVGAKTLLDVLVPVAQVIADGASPEETMVLADHKAQATIDMVATRGRASFLKERSVGHMDPGARSSQLLINTICQFYSEAA